MEIKDRFTVFLIGMAFFTALTFGCAKKEEVPTPTVTEGVVIGKVEADGKPLAGVKVGVFGLDISAETGTDGSFKLTGLMEGTWDITFEKEGFTSSPVTVTLGAGETKDIGTVTMVQTGNISGVVKVQGETTFGGISVSIKELPELPPVKTKDDGSFLISGIAPGVYTIIVEKTGYEPVKTTVEVEGGKTFEVPEILIKGKTIPEKGNLVLYLKLDEGQGNTVKDSAGGPDLTIEGTPNWIPGKVGKALKFDGGQGITVPADRVNSITGQLTVAAWIRVDSPSSSTNQGGIRRQGAWLLEVENPDEKGGVGFSAVLWIGGSNVRADGEIPFQLGKWHHVAAVYDGTELRLYVDGKLDVKTSASGNIDIPADPLTIGRWSTEMIDGALDEIMIWNKALTEDQIKSLAG